MHDDTPSPKFKCIHEFFKHKQFTGEKIIEWPPSSRYLNLIENLWSFVKMIYKDGKLYNSKADLWEGIKKTILLEIGPTEVKQINKINRK